jgi:hypothetical protein
MTKDEISPVDTSFLLIKNLNIGSFPEDLSPGA